MHFFDACCSALTGNRVPSETARNAFYFLRALTVMSVIMALPTPEPMKASPL